MSATTLHNVDVSEADSRPNAATQFKIRRQKDKYCEKPPSGPTGSKGNASEGETQHCATQAVVHTGDILYCTNTHLVPAETEAVRCIFKSNNTSCTLREQGNARHCRERGGGHADYERGNGFPAQQVQAPLFTPQGGGRESS